MATQLLAPPPPLPDAPYVIGIESGSPIHAVAQQAAQQAVWNGDNDRHRVHTHADGPSVEYDLSITYPNEGGRVGEGGRDRAAVVARRLRLEADRLDRLVPPTDPVGTVRRSPEGVVAVKRGDWRHSWRGSDGYDHDHDDVADWVRLVPAASVAVDAAELVAKRMLRIKLYGVALNERYNDLARRQWNKQLTDEERADWLNDAKALLVDLGVARSDSQVPAGGDLS